MPHLSPMSWKLMALTILMLITTISMFFWWSQLPLFPPQKSQHPSTSFTLNPWHWN